MVENASRTPRSDALYDRALDIIPWGTQTGSKRPPADLRGVYPPYIARGQGAYAWDLDGNRYIDFKLGCGPVILGHAYEPVNRAVAAQLTEGIVYGSAHPLEVTLAEMLVRLIPCAEMARYLKSGAEGTSAAVRLSRAYTGKDRILSYGYHGWHDWCIGRGKGVPQAIAALTTNLPYNDPEALEATLRRYEGQVAGVIVTPSIYSPAEWDMLGAFLQGVRRACDAYGVVLVYDEIVSGFRTALGGVQELTGVTPDLTVVSKAMANGFPISAVVGKRAVMEAWNETVITSTFAGETMSMAAAVVTLGVFESQDVTAHLWQMGRLLIDGVNEIARAKGLPLLAGGCPGLPSVQSQDGERGQALLDGMMSGLLERGIMPYSPSLWYICHSHTAADIEQALSAIAGSIL